MTKREAWAEQLRKDMGRAIRGARLKRGFTQKQLADAVYLTESTIARYEAGDRSMPLENAVMIARRLDVPLGTLVAEPGALSPSSPTLTAARPTISLPAQLAPKHVQAIEHLVSALGSHPELTDRMMGHLARELDQMAAALAKGPVP